MSRSLPAGTRVRRVAAAAALVFAVASLSACGDSGGAATTEVAPDNANTVVNGVHVDNVQLVVDPAAPGEVAVTASLVNDSKQADELTGVTIGGGGGAATLTPVKGGGSSIAVPVGELVKLGGKDAASAVVTTDAVKAGAFKAVTFTFGKAGRATVSASTHEAVGELSGYGPTPTAAPTLSPLSSPSASATATASASASSH